VKAAIEALIHCGQLTQRGVATTRTAATLVGMF
jgi:hypothetical protein